MTRSALSRLRDQARTLTQSRFVRQVHGEIRQWQTVNPDGYRTAQQVECRTT